MYEICIDQNGYYTSGCDGTLVTVHEIPEVSDLRYLPAYQYEAETSSLSIDETRLAAIKAEIGPTPENISREKRLEALESAVFELINNTYEGGDGVG